MVMVEVAGKRFYMDGYLKHSMDFAGKIIRKDWDFLFIVDGRVGSGKSVLAQTLAWYCAKGKLSLDAICFNPMQFRKAILKAEPYSAVIFDEAFRGLSSRAAMSQTNKIIVSMLQEIRQKNLFVFVVIPSIWDLDSYVAKHRCAGLIHVYTGKERERGYFSFYNEDRVMDILKESRNKYKYPAKRNFYGRFTKFYPVGKAEYELKKKESLGDYGHLKKKKVEKPNPYREHLLLLSKLLKEKFGVTYKEQTELLGRSQEYYKGIRKKHVKAVNSYISEARNGNSSAVVSYNLDEEHKLEENTTQETL